MLGIRAGGVRCPSRLSGAAAFGRAALQSSSFSSRWSPHSPARQRRTPGPTPAPRRHSPRPHAHSSTPMRNRPLARRLRPTGVSRSGGHELARRGVGLVECEAAPGGGYCGTLHVPLDRAHPDRGTVRLFFLFYRHRKPGPARSAIMLSEGGPGYSITNTEFEKQAYLDSFGSLMARRDLVMLDQRGVGRSGVIQCPALQRDPAYWLPSIQRKVSACARGLGDTATVYGSGDVALDMEASAAPSASRSSTCTAGRTPPRTCSRTPPRSRSTSARPFSTRRSRPRLRDTGSPSTTSAPTSPGGAGGGRPAVRSFDQLLHRAVGRPGGPGLARQRLRMPGHGRPRLRGGRRLDVTESRWRGASSGR